MSDETTFLIRLPPNLRKEFKIACVINDKSMSEVIRELMQEYIDKNKPS